MDTANTVATIPARGAWSVPLHRVGDFGLAALWSLIAFLSVVYAANVLGPPPPSAEAIAPVSMLLWLTPLWAWWADRNRVSVTEG